MPYTADISRAKPGCFLFLIDQSGSMEEGLGGQARSAKKERCGGCCEPGSGCDFAEMLSGHGCPRLLPHRTYHIYHRLNREDGA